MWKPSSQKPETRCYHSNVSLAGLANPQGISGRLGPGRHLGWVERRSLGAQWGERPWRGKGRDPLLPAQPLKFWGEEGLKTFHASPDGALWGIGCQPCSALAPSFPVAQGREN